MKLVIDWQLSSYFGWGIYGINLALEWARRPDIEAHSAHVVRLDQVAVGRLRLNAIAPFVRRSNMQQAPPPDAIILHALGNDFAGDIPEKQPRIGVVFFEEPLSPAGVERARRYDTIVAGSTWNADVLKGHGLGNVVTLIQGVDRSLFHPAPCRNLYPGRFLIFSGGKAEPRKGQDLVVAAFRVFAQRHPEAMLVTAWHSPWPQLRFGMDIDLSGLLDRVIDIGAAPNSAMAPIYRECHVGLFPSRAEGGTNLVAMELIACGVPAIVSANTGHLDLLRLTNVRGIYSKPATGDQSGPGEPNLEQMLYELERIFDGEVPRGEDRLPGWDVAAQGLIDVCRP